MDDSDTLGDTMVYSTWLHGDSHITLATSLTTCLAVLIFSYSHSAGSMACNKLMLSEFDDAWWLVLVRAPGMSRSKSHGF